MADRKEAEKLAENTKVLVNCYLVTEEKGVLLSSLPERYRKFLGEDIPHVKLGYATLSDYLKSIPDAVKLTTLPSGEVLCTCVSNDSNEHIIKMKKKEVCLLEFQQLFFSSIRRLNGFT